MQVNRTAKQWNNHLNNLLDEAGAGRAKAATGAARAYPGTNFVRQASSLVIR